MKNIFVICFMLIVNIEIYGANWCGYCQRAKALLDDKKVSYKYYDISKNLALKKYLIQQTKQNTIPQIFVDSEHIGGYSDLHNLNESGKLDQMIKK